MNAPAIDTLQTVQVFKMMKRLGIDSDVGALPQNGLRYATALQRCRKCPSKTACRKWLDQSMAANCAPSFCPNADILFELQYDQPGWNPLSHTPAEMIHVTHD